MNEKVQKTPEEIEQLAFDAGFNSETGTTAARPETDDKAQPIKEEPPKPAIEAKPSETKPKPLAKPKDEYVRLTKLEYESLKTNAGKVPELEKRIETAFGKFGPLTQMINELKAATPKGQAVELPADVVSELEAEFPELAGGVKAALTKALKGLIGTGKSDAAPNEDVFKTRIEEWAVNRAAADLAEEHPQWREIVGAVAKGAQPDAAHPFRAWLAKQPEDYQARINNTINPMVISTAITKFQASQRAPALTPIVPVRQSKKSLLRRKRFQGSVQPKGLGTPPPAQKESVEDAFASGYRTG
jgi:hypothetical protein